MKQTMSISDMAEQLHNDTNAAWTYEGARALAEYLDEHMPEDSEFDRVEIRCNWSQHESLTEWAEDYFGSGCWADDIGASHEPDSCDVDDKIRDFINDRGIFIEFGSGVIVSSF